MTPAKTKEFSNYPVTLRILGFWTAPHLGTEHVTSSRSRPVHRWTSKLKSESEVKRCKASCHLAAFLRPQLNDRVGYMSPHNKHHKNRWSTTILQDPKGDVFKAFTKRTYGKSSTIIASQNWCLGTPSFHVPFECSPTWRWNRLGNRKTEGDPEQLKVLNSNPHQNQLKQGANLWWFVVLETWRWEFLNFRTTETQGFLIF